MFFKNKSSKKTKVQGKHKSTKGVGKDVCSALKIKLIKKTWKYYRDDHH